jgi:preprotein translocase subunit SecE
MRRLAQKQGTATPQQAAKSTADLRQARLQKRAPQQAPGPKRQRTSAGKFVRESIAELKKVEWPSRNEVTTYGIVVLVTLVVLGLYVFGADLLLARAIFAFFKG